jgi:pyruvate,water dikinase
MVRAGSGSSGVMFTYDPESGHEGVVVLSALYGLGETLVQGRANSDEWIVHKKTLQQGYPSIVTTKLGTKTVKLVDTYEARDSKLESEEANAAKVSSAAAVDATGMVTNNSRDIVVVPVSAAASAEFCLTSSEVLQLARWSLLIESHYSGRAGRTNCPMDIEFARDGIDGTLWVVQARPQTVTSRKDRDKYVSFQLDKQQASELKTAKLISGVAVGTGIVTGRVCVLHSMEQRAHFHPGDILVTECTHPDWLTVLQMASGIITSTGGRTCHAALVAREIGVPAVIGVGNAWKQLSNGEEVSICCLEGDVGKVYGARVRFSRTVYETSAMRQAWKSSAMDTRLQLIVSQPHRALALAAMPVSGVGLMRLEFTLASVVQVHPLALLHYETLADSTVRAQIDALTPHYDSLHKVNYFVDAVASAIGLLAAAFSPRDVVVRFSDFKSTEYRALIGGALFEPHEENPAIGWRGASRYYDPRYAEAFKLECKAVKRVRDMWVSSNDIGDVASQLCMWCHPRPADRGVLCVFLDCVRIVARGCATWW